MRGKVPAVVASVLLMGITPAYAGKRGDTNGRNQKDEDHPRVCGEKEEKHEP